MSSSAADLSALLAPLRARQTRWLAGDADDDPEDPATVWAQPLVVRLERSAPPDRLLALEAAATASLSVLADRRACGEWREACQRWVAGRIRKVARRARGAHWHAALELPGVTVTRSGPGAGAGVVDSGGESAGLGAAAVGRAEVRAFPPYLVADTPPYLRRLQVGGTELPDLVEPPPPSRMPVLWLNPDAGMSAGKAMAQVGHAAMLLAAFAALPDLARWLEAGLSVAVRDAPPTRWRELAGGPVEPERRFAETGTVVVRDAGFTEIEPGTVTVVAQLR